MGKLHILGDKKHALKILKIFENLGYKNPHHFSGDSEWYTYTWNDNGVVDMKAMQDGDVKMTYQEFIDKYPHTVGDKVQSEQSIYIIQKMRWNSTTNTIEYYVANGIGEMHIVDLSTVKKFVKDEPETKSSVKHIKLTDTSKELKVELTDGWECINDGTTFIFRRKVDTFSHNMMI